MTARRVAVVHRKDMVNDLVLAGIERFRRDGPPWILRHQYSVPALAEEVEEFLAWKPEGILALSPLPPRLLRCGIPVVSLLHRQTGDAVLSDDDAVGVAAAEHLSRLGTAVGLLEFGAEASGWYHDRSVSFIAELERRGQRAHRLPWQPPVAERGAYFAELLRHAPRPLALFCLNDYFAREILEAAMAADVRVPADLALLGADDCSLAAESAIPLSSVRVAHGEIGRRGAARLAALIAGGAGAPRCETVPPDGVSERRSSDPIGLRDPEVAAVLRFIRSHAGEAFDVADAVSAATLSRRSLENRFRSVLGRSILEEIHRVRIERAQALLADPRRTVADVALDCGFTDAAHFSEVFRRFAGTTPSSWRKERAG